jgi:cell division septum initiation protein DivIVA
MRSKSKIRKRTTEPQGAVACDTIEETPSDQSFISESQQDIAAASLLSNDTLAQRKYMSHNADPRYNDNSSLESREVASKIPGETILAEDQEDMVFELAQYKHRCQKAEQECANLKKELRQMQSDYAQANGLQEKILMQLRSRTQLNIKQQNQLNDKKDLEPYLAIGKAWDNMPTIRKLLVDYKDMKEKLSSVLLFNEERPISAETLYGRSDDLDLLLRTVLHIDEQEKATNTLKIAPTFKIRECIQALTGAAIKIWVFESTYKSISMMVTPVLKHYRSQVASLCTIEPITLFPSHG